MRRKPIPHTRRVKKPKPVPDPTAPVRRSMYVERELYREIEALAKREERKTSDMIRLLLRRGLAASRGPGASS